VPITFKNGKYDSCFLKTTEILAINDGFISNSGNLSFIISDDQNINERWTLTADGGCIYHNLFSLSYMPYFAMDLEENHSLLWRYQEDLINCQLKGFDILNDKQKNELIGELAKYYSKDAGGFFESHPILNPIRDSNGNLILETNQKVFELIEPILRKHEITIENYHVLSSNQKGSSNNQNLKVLLIRNPFVTSVNAIREQTFIIANELKFEKNSTV